MKRTLWKTILGLVLCLALCQGALPAKAEDCFLINVDALDMNALRDNDYIAENLSGQSPGIRVQKYISDSAELAARVRLTVLQYDTQTLIFDKNYGYQSGTFDSGEIYLPYVDNRTVPYLITLYIEDWVFAMPFMHLVPRLSHNGACTYGVRMRDLNPSLTSDWLMGTMLDLDLLREEGWQSIPICASNEYLVGEAVVTLAQEQLTVNLSFTSNAKVELHQCAVFLLTQVSELITADPPYMTQPAYAIGEGIDVSGASTALLYLPMTMSYDSAALSTFAYDLNGDVDLQRQWLLWTENLGQALEPLSEEPSMDPAAVEPPFENPQEAFQDEVPPEAPPETLPPEPTVVLPEESQWIPQETEEPMAQEVSGATPEPGSETPEALPPEVAQDGLPNTLDPAPEGLLQAPSDIPGETVSREPSFHDSQNGPALGAEAVPHE